MSRLLAQTVDDITKGASQVSHSFLNEGVAITVLALLTASGLAWFWLVYVPRSKKKWEQQETRDQAEHDKDIELKSTLITNITDQTKTLESVRNSMKLHSDQMMAHAEQCKAQSAGECGRLHEIETQVSNHNLFLVESMEEFRKAMRKYAPDISDEINLDATCSRLKDRLMHRNLPGGTA